MYDKCHITDEGFFMQYETLYDKQSCRYIHNTHTYIITRKIYVYTGHVWWKTGNLFYIMSSSFYRDTADLREHLPMSSRIIRKCLHVVAYVKLVVIITGVRMYFESEVVAIRV